jgi:hypothetical protein
MSPSRPLTIPFETALPIYQGHLWAPIPTTWHGSLQWQTTLDPLHGQNFQRMPVLHGIGKLPKRLVKVYQAVLHSLDLDREISHIRQSGRTPVFSTPSPRH